MNPDPQARRNELEQRRRDLKGADPALYSYLAHTETAKALDSLGDRLSGLSHAAANTCWAQATMHRRYASADPVLGFGFTTSETGHRGD